MPLFEVIAGKRDEPKERWSRYNDEVYNDPQEANEVAKEQNDYYNRLSKMYRNRSYDLAFMIRRITGERDFAAREIAREDYKPFEVQGHPHHFAELKEDKISYFATIENAEDNRRTEIKLGRYLRKYTNLHDNEIAEICARNGVDCGDMSVQFACTRDEIAHVYEKGPSSCMKSSRNAWDGNVHPAEAYATPDLAVAYIVRDDRITARTVVVPEKKLYVSIYGDETRMEAALQAEGYSHDFDALVGCRLLKCPTGVGDRHAMPYIDSEGYVADLDATYFIFTEDKGSTTGEHGYVRECDTNRGRSVGYDPYEDEDEDEEDDDHW